MTKRRHRGKKKDPRAKQTSTLIRGLIQCHTWEPGKVRRLMVHSDVWHELVREVEPEHVVRYGGLVSCEATLRSGHMNVLFDGVAICPIKNPNSTVLK